MGRVRNSPDIGGVWRSKCGRVVHVITRVRSHVLWRVLENGRMVNSGLGWFPRVTEEAGSFTIEALWNFESERPGGGAPLCKGEVILRPGAAPEVLWKDE